MFVLYVGRDKDDPSEYCPGSLVCMSLVEKIEEDIQIQDCNILKSSQALPSWLNGTPILISRKDPEPHRGTEAVRVLQFMLREQQRNPGSNNYDEESHRETVPRVTTRQQQNAAPPRMMPGQMTRQPSEKRQLAEPHRHLTTQGDPIRPDVHDGEDEEAMDTMANGAATQYNSNIRDDKVTEQDLQRYMEARNASAASAGNTGQAQGQTMPPGTM